MICLSRGRKPISCSIMGSNSGDKSLSACVETHVRMYVSVCAQKHAQEKP